MNDSFSLLDQPWLPLLRARLASGARDWLRPADIAADIGDDPIVAIAWGRADFDAATREFPLSGATGVICSWCL